MKFGKKVDGNQVLDALKEIQYPGYERDIVSLGIVKNVTVKNGIVSFSITFFTETDEMKKQIIETIEKKVRSLKGVADINIDIKQLKPQAPIAPAQPPRQQQAAPPPPPAAERGDPWAGRAPIPGIKHIVAVASGKGGVGKSTVAVNLSVALSREGAKVGLMDSDVYGPSIPMMLGIEEPPQADEQKRIIPLEKHNLKLMSIGFISGEDAPVIWRGPLVSQIVEQFLRNVAWGDLDVLVIDMPPGTGDAQLTLVQKVPLSGAVIVTTPQDISLIDARKGLKMFEKVDTPVFGIVENMSHFLCPHCGEATDIFGSGGGKKASEELDVPLLGEVPIDPRVRIGGDDGHPIMVKHSDSEVGEVFTKVARTLLETLNLSIKASA